MMPHIVYDTDVLHCNTTDTTYNVTSGPTQNETYEFFVVSYCNDDTPVLPSVNSSIESVTLSKL